MGYPNPNMFYLAAIPAFRYDPALPMDAQLVKATIKAYLTEIRNVPCVAVNAFCSLGNVSVSLSVFTDGP
jgi:hypothetical protein